MSTRGVLARVSSSFGLLLLAISLGCSEPELKPKTIPMMTDEEAAQLTPRDLDNPHTKMRVSSAQRQRILNRSTKSGG